MSQSAEAKLQELRGKTNRQLVSLIVNKLDRGMACAQIEVGEYADAERDLQDARVWMSLLHEASEIDRRRMEFKAAQLRSMLDRTRALELKAHAAC